MVLSNEERAAWLARRHTLLTASDAAAVFGLNGSRSRADVLRDKRRPVAVEDETVGKVTQVRAGKYLEAGIIEWFAADHPLAVVSKLPPDAIYITPQCDRLAATPDGLCDGGPLEAKNVGEAQCFNWSVVGVAYELAPHNGRKAKCVWPAELGALPEPDDTRAFYAMEYTARSAKAEDDVLTEWREVRNELMDLRFTFEGWRAPLKYWVQLQVQMMALSTSDGWITAAVGGTSRIDLHYTAHTAFQSWAVEQTRRFWEEV